MHIWHQLMNRQHSQPQALQNLPSLVPLIFYRAPDTGSKTAPEHNTTTSKHIAAHFGKKTQVFISSDHRVFPYNVFSLSMWFAANFSHASQCHVWRHFLPGCVNDTTVPCTLYLQTVVCTVDLGTCNCFENDFLPSDFLHLFKSIMRSFRSMLSSLDFPIVVSVAESNGCIKQALLKWAQKSHQLSSIIITQKKLSGHEVKRPCYKAIFDSHNFTKIGNSICCIYIFDSADWVTF